MADLEPGIVFLFMLAGAMCHCETSNLVLVVNFSLTCTRIESPWRVKTAKRLHASAPPSSLSPTSSAISRNCSNAPSRSSMMPRRMTAGAGRLSESSRLSSLSQKMSRLALSRAMISS